MKKILFCFLLLFIIGCVPLGLGNATDCASDTALFDDDFEGDRNCGWAEYNEGGAIVEITGGVMQVSSSQPGQIWWTNPGKKFEDAVITVEAKQEDGPDDNAYGVMCRYQDVENFYAFLVSGDGYFSIAKYQSGSRQAQHLLEGGEFQPSDTINQGRAVNFLRASCIGNELSLSINGLPVATVTDPTFVLGDVGIGTSTFQPGTAVVAFDDFKVTAP